MVDETLFDYLHMAVVDHYIAENEKDSESSSLSLSQIGRPSRRCSVVCQHFSVRLPRWLLPQRTTLQREPSLSR